ncbi:head-tail connector protein [Pediococcus acidilactici]|uniref:head-tail connector protein n=1 Tax=Pediococcus acidilactici TaxID=1254 RepID=UPI001BD43877|nr:head-tail connector protein [Pediococcus acidilactici]MBS9400085.1 head-tail connector protein [Pediococcus acidilactici]
MKNIPDDIYKEMNEMLHDSLRVPIGVDDKLLDQYLKASVSYVLTYTGTAPAVINDDRFIFLCVEMGSFLYENRTTQIKDIAAPLKMVMDQLALNGFNA